MWRIPGERVALDLDGPSVEVEPIHSWMLQSEALRLWRAFEVADSGSATEYGALAALIDRFVVEAQPTWDFADHLGPIPVTGRGMARLPINLQIGILGEWLNTLQAAKQAEREPLALSVVESDAPTAVDAVLPPGPVNREIKRRLKVAKRAA